MEVHPSSRGTGNTQDKEIKKEKEKIYEAKEMNYTTTVTTQSKRKHTTIDYVNTQQYRSHKHTYTKS